MSIDKMAVSDSVVAVLGDETGVQLSRLNEEKQVARANVHALLLDSKGMVKYEEVGENLVTDYGDQFLATRSFSNAVNIVTGMKLGTGSTAASKAGAGATLVTYISGSQRALDATATDSDKGTGAGHRAIHITTWAAGVVTNAAIREVVLTNQTALADNTGAANVVVARFVFASAIDKQAGDSLAVTWNIDILGA